MIEGIGSKGWGTIWIVLPKELLPSRIRILNFKRASLLVRCFAIDGLRVCVLTSLVNITIEFFLWVPVRA